MIVDLEDENDKWGDLKKFATTIKDGTFVAPVPEAEAEEAKSESKAVESGDELPNFAEMLLSVVSDDSKTEIKNGFERLYQSDISNISKTSASDYNRELQLFELITTQDRGTLWKLYKEYKVLNEALCRSALMEILESAGSTLNEAAAKLLN